MSNHPSENAEPSTRTVDAGTDPILIWYGLIKTRLDAALFNVDEAYRNAKLAAINLDTTNRNAAKERREKDPAGLVESSGIFDHESDALHRTHLRAMEVYSSLAGAMASSVRDVLSMQQLELTELIES